MFRSNALQHAARKCDTETVRLLLQNGADVNAKSENYGTALQAATERGTIETIRLLLENGADVNAKAKIMELLSRLLQDATVRLLLDNGADVNVEGGPDGTPLQVAALGGNIDIVVLLEKNANVNAQAGLYRTALHVAASRGHTEVMRQLLDKSADINAQEGSYGRTPLHLAVEAKSFPAVAELIQRNALTTKFHRRNPDPTCNSKARPADCNTTFPKKHW
ncbi:ankyrin-2 [Penicillium lividum]|nr:ankyrin-2 [Penicillium lividum]